MAGEIRAVIPVVENERLRVDAREEPFAGRQQFLQFASHEIRRPFRDVPPMRVGRAPRNGIERRVAQRPHRAG